MSWESDQIVYNRLRKRKHSPTESVRILHLLKFKPKKIKKQKLAKLRYFRSDPETYEELQDQVDYLDSLPEEEKQPLSQRIDFGMQPERREIAKEATVREMDRIGNGVRTEMRSTGEQLHIVKPRHPTREALTRGAKTGLRYTGQALKVAGKGVKYGAEKAYKGAWTATHYPQVVDERIARTMAEHESKYGPRYPAPYEPEPTSENIGYERRKKRKSKKRKNKVHKHRKK